MKKEGLLFPLLVFIFMAFTGCGVVGDENISLAVIYGVCLLLSLLLLTAYCAFCKTKDKWFLLVFISVFVVNLGYFALSCSQNLKQALWANRIAYFGSVFLPLAMFMIILKVTNIRYRSRLTIVLFCISFVVFLVAASPGFLPIYYKDVGFELVNGIGKLTKVYGPLHILYMFYLMGYFGSMIVAIVYSFVKKTADTVVHSVVIAIAVLVNLGVWFLEQFTKFEFEFLAISYLISELFLLGLTFLIKEHQKLKEMVRVKNLVTTIAPQSVPTLPEHEIDFSQVDLNSVECFVAGYKTLTKTERAVFNGYIHRLTTKEIMDSLGITENTLKFHNKNLYGKLGVTSRKQLMALYEQVKEIKGNFEE